MPVFEFFGYGCGDSGTLGITVGDTAQKLGLAPTSKGTLEADLTVSGEKDIYIYCKVNAINLFSLKWEAGN